jgi:hypothetical protein
MPRPAGPPARNIPVSAAPLTRLAVRECLTAFGSRLEGYTTVEFARLVTLPAVHQVLGGAPVAVLERIVAGRGGTQALLAVVLACLSGCDRPNEAYQFGQAETAAASACRMPIERTTVRAEDGAILETWEVSLEDVLTDELPGEPPFLEFRAAIERDGADLRRPVRDPPVTDSDEAAAIWRDEFFNQDLVFDGVVGVVEPISCLDALLFTRQAARVSQLEKPTEFVASVLRREATDGIRLLIVFGAGSDTLVPRGWYGTDLVGEYLNDGWRLWYVIHNHTTQKNGGRLALGAPVPSTNDVQLNRALAVQGLDSVRVTNGFYTFRASTADMSLFRAR